MSALKPVTLSMRWSKREKCMLISYPSKPDGHLLHVRLNAPRFTDSEEQPSFVQELEARGYDLTTLRFSIRRKVQL
jgi:hypothetical protein